jgi:hypothetical protein
VENYYESAMACQALEAQRYHLVAFTGMSLGSASNGDGSPSESILEALNKSVTRTTRKIGGQWRNIFGFCGTF